MLLLLLKLDVMCEVVFCSDLHVRCMGPGLIFVGQYEPQLLVDYITIAVFLMTSPVTTPASPALLITYKAAAVSQKVDLHHRLLTQMLLRWLIHLSDLCCRARDVRKYLKLDDAAKPDLQPVLQASQQHGDAVRLADQPCCVKRKVVETGR